MKYNEIYIVLTLQESFWRSFARPRRAVVAPIWYKDDLKSTVPVGSLTPTDAGQGHPGETQEASRGEELQKLLGLKFDAF